MVKLKKIKLSNQIDCELKEREMYMLRGGNTEDPNVCACGCAYADCGGSTTVDNASANMKYGLSSDSGNIQCFIEGWGATVDMTIFD